MLGCQRNSTDIDMGFPINRQRTMPGETRRPRHRMNPPARTEALRVPFQLWQKLIWQPSIPKISTVRVPIAPNMSFDWKCIIEKLAINNLDRAPELNCTRFWYLFSIHLQIFPARNRISIIIQAKLIASNDSLNRTHPARHTFQHITLLFTHIINFHDLFQFQDFPIHLMENMENMRNSPRRDYLDHKGSHPPFGSFHSILAHHYR